MADRTLTINHADGGSETYTINRDKFAGVRDMVIDGANVSVDHTAVPKEQSKETTFGGSQSITVNRDIEPLLSKVVGGAAAAYSLRDLNDSQGNNNVVRVRRESDNSEKDFKAKEVSNGTMARWVNEQPTLPLDLRELDTNTGERDGALIEAAAAYSLRKLKEDFTGDVVEVRRNVDGETEGFTAAEVTDGTLESFVNASFDEELPLDQATGAAAAYSLRNLSSSFTGDVVEVRRSSDDAVQSFTASEVADGTLEGWVGTGNDGFVRTWYDQSGSDNHAVQTTTANQPKIVEGGTLVTGGIDFDGAGQKLVTPTTSVLNIDGAKDKSIFAKGTFTASEDFVFLGNIATNGEAIRYRSTGGNARLEVQGGGVNGGSLLGADGAVYSSIFSGTQLSDSDVSSNGSITDATGTLSINTANTVLDIGYLNGTLSEGAGQLSELIIYDSDQSDKRRAIEENIANHYDISLAAFSRDGTVSTWYDQSETNGVPNANHAVQTDTTKQPKIVDGGTLVADGIDFDGTNDFLSINFGAALSQPNSIFMVHTSDTATDSKNEFFDSADGTPRTLFDQSGAYYRMFAGANQITSLTVDANQKTLVGAFYNTTSSFLSKNGTVSSTLSVGTSSIDDTSNIGYSALGGRYYDGSMDEFIIYNSDQSDNRTAIEANIGETYGITAIPAANDTVNGYVQTWYDQSGNGNDAVQNAASSQPKIVGEVTSGQPHAFLGALDFDGSGDELDLSGAGLDIFKNVGYGQVFSVVTSDETGLSTANIFGALTGTGVPRFLISESNATSASFRIGGRRLDADSFDSTTASVGHGNTERLVTGFLNWSDGEAYLYQDGTNVGTDLSFQTAGNTENTSSSAAGIGRSNFDGRIREIIVYNSDQSSNRPAIETNIANQYGITLS